VEGGGAMVVERRIFRVAAWEFLDLVVGSRLHFIDIVPLNYIRELGPEYISDEQYHTEDLESIQDGGKLHMMYLMSIALAQDAYREMAERNVSHHVSSRVLPLEIDLEVTAEAESEVEWDRVGHLRTLRWGPDE
jgi:hypothetical protein